MTVYNIAFDESQYRAIAERAAKLYQAKGMSSNIPLKRADVLDAAVYRYTYLGDPIVSSSGNEWSAKGERARVVHQYTDINLYTDQMFLYVDINDKAKYSEQLLADKRGAIIDKFALEVDYRNFHGPHTRTGGSSAGTGGIQLAEGLVGQLTSIENLDGTDSLLNVKGDIWYALNTMIDAIPFNLRQEGPPMTLITDEHVAKELYAPDRIYQDQLEGDLVKRIIMGADAPEGRKVGKHIVNNNILALAADDTDGNNADTVDTVGTHSRMMLYVPDERWVGRCISRGFDLIGEETGALDVTQIWGHKGRAYWFNTDTAEYSEAITWA